MVVTYQLWVHRPSGQVYIVQLTARNARSSLQVTGACGPLDPLSVTADGQFAGYEYSAGIGAWVAAHRDEFTVLLPRSRVRRSKGKGPEVPDSMEEENS